MRVESWSISKLMADPSNVRLHPAENLTAIKASLARFGQQKPIVVDPAGCVVAGNGTLAAAKELGWDTLAVVVTKLEGVDRVAYGIADNRTQDLSEFDEPGLAKLLAAIEDPALQEATGFSDEDMGRFAAEDAGFPDIASGDKPDVGVMSFSVTDAERVEVQAAIDAASGDSDGGGNRNTRGLLALARAYGAG